MSTEVKRSLIDKNHSVLSVKRQCDLLALSKGALYYESLPMDSYSLALMDLIDEQFLKTPFYGRRRMTAYLTTITDVPQVF